MGVNSLPKTASRLQFEPRPYCAWVQHANHSATEPPAIKWTISKHRVCCRWNYIILGRLACTAACSCRRGSSVVCLLSVCLVRLIGTESWAVRYRPLWLLTLSHPSHHLEFSVHTLGPASCVDQHAFSTNSLHRRHCGKPIANCNKSRDSV